MRIQAVTHKHEALEPLFIRPEVEYDNPAAGDRGVQQFGFDHGPCADLEAPAFLLSIENRRPVRAAFGTVLVPIIKPGADDREYQ